MRPTTKRKNTANGPGRQKVRIEFHAEHAEQVQLAGTFNDWRPDTTPMLAVGGGRWGKELMLPSGRYEYLFVVDWEWKCDPARAERAPNPFGTLNSVLKVRGSHEPALPRSKPTSGASRPDGKCRMDKYPATSNIMI